MAYFEQHPFQIVNLAYWLSEEQVQLSLPGCAVNELDMVFLGQLSAFTNNTETTAEKCTCRHLITTRKYPYTTYFHKAKPLCSAMFSFLFTVGKKRMRNLASHLMLNGLVPCLHGKTHRRPSHALSFLFTQHVVHFLLIYAEQHALLIPGRVPGYSRSDIKLLPSSTSKRGIWRIMLLLLSIRAYMQ